MKRISTALVVAIPAVVVAGCDESPSASGGGAYAYQPVATVLSVS